MGTHAGTAEKIAKIIAREISERADEDKSVVQTANNMVANLQEFADDMNAALKKYAPTLDAHVAASAWKKDGNAVRAALTISRGDEKFDIPIEFLIGSTAVNVSGSPVTPGEGAQ